MATTAEIAELMGGKKVFGVSCTDTLGITARIQKGLPYIALEKALKASAFGLSDLKVIGLPRRSLTHRKSKGALSPDQSDRLFRFMRIYTEALNTFDDKEKARTWLRRNTKPLGNRTPFEMLATGEGTRLVEQLLGRVAHGIGA